jgi:hypothetical protein
VRGLAKPRPDRRGFSFPELTFPLIVLYAMTADDARARAKAALNAAVRSAIRQQRNA